YISSNTIPITIKGVSNLCYNPYGRLGRCISMTKCLRLKNGEKDIVNWHCNYGRGLPPYVCCTFGNSIVFPDDDDDYYRTPPPKPPIVFPAFFRDMIQNKDASVNNPARSSSANSVFQATEDGNTENNMKNETWVIHGGVEAELGEFPWLVNLEYRTEDGDIQIGCAGNILKNRYVLTAAHCVKGPIEELLGNLVSMRVGDHNTDTDNDCDDLGCIDRFIRYYIIEKIVHKDFRQFKRGRLINDIALLKTDNEMIYSFSVAPICLPNIQQALHPPVNGSTLTVAGWGDNGIEDFSVEKRIVDVPYIDNSVCPLRLLPTQICAGGVKGKDSCVGDSGGSLARRSTGGWIIEGMVSYGRNCGSDTPAVYTRVRSFLPWIMDHVNDS
ncbi:serine protease 7-like, partial [Musca vetustissima]|uniref:serine protease 7-like n=1 Tax=Musca vetustissima TaxID=27455 RepID=UPI002AB5FF91